MEIVEFRGTVHLFLYTMIRSALVFLFLFLWLTLTRKLNICKAVSIIYSVLIYLNVRMVLSTINVR